MSSEALYGNVLVRVMADKQAHRKQDLLDALGGPVSRLWLAMEWARKNGVYIYCVDKATRSYRWLDALPEIRHQNGRLRNQIPSRLAVASREQQHLQVLALALGTTVEHLKECGRLDEAKHPKYSSAEETREQQLREAAQKLRDETQRLHNERMFQQHVA